MDAWQIPWFLGNPEASWLIKNHRGGRGDWVSPRVGNYSKPRVLKER